MKYLQLYDHLGNLVKEFEVYVEGQDFNWAASKPEPVWFGTIRLVAEKAVGEVEPTPEPELSDTRITKEHEEAMRQAAIDAGVIEPEPEAEEEAEVTTQAPFITTLKPIEKQPESEVKDEPEKRSHKGRGSKGTRSQSRSKRS